MLLILDGFPCFKKNEKEENQGWKVSTKFRFYPEGEMVCFFYLQLIFENIRLVDMVASYL